MPYVHKPGFEDISNSRLHESCRPEAFVSKIADRDCLGAKGFGRSAVFKVHRSFV